MEQKYSCIIGVDPGSSNGGIAVYIPGRNIKTLRMPKDVRELAQFFAYYAENYRPLVMLEKLNIRPDDLMGGNANPGKVYRIQKLLANFEQLKAIIEASGTPYCLVHPMSWQKRLGLRVQGVKEEKAERKNRYKQTAAAWYPGVKVTLWNSDALLLMHFGRWVVVNDPRWVESNLPSKVKSMQLF